jgi:hypothetical protein
MYEKLLDERKRSPRSRLVSAAHHLDETTLETTTTYRLLLNQGRMLRFPIECRTLSMMEFVNLEPRVTIEDLLAD